MAGPILLFTWVRIETVGSVCLSPTLIHVVHRFWRPRGTCTQVLCEGCLFVSSPAHGNSSHPTPSLLSKRKEKKRKFKKKKKFYFRWETYMCMNKFKDLHVHEIFNWMPFEIYSSSFDHFVKVGPWFIDLIGWSVLPLRTNKHTCTCTVSL